MKAIVSVKDAVKNYTLGNVVVPALRGVTLDVTEGDFIAIAGPSGSGKTTLLNLIGCVDTPTSGTVEVEGKDTRRLSERQLTTLRLHTIGFIFQSFNLVSVLSVFQNVELPLLLQRRLSGSERAQRVMSLLDRVGIREYANPRPSELSGGQRQRVAIARSMANDPDIVLADEPTGNLDQKNGQIVFEIFTRLATEYGKSVITVTHDPHLAEQTHRQIHLVDGRIVDDGSKDRAQPAEPAATASSWSPG